MSKPNNPLQRKSLRDRKKRFEETLQEKAAHLIEREREAVRQEPQPPDLGDPNIGDKMPDGSIYAGLSPDTGRPMYAMPADALLTLSFNEAADFANRLNRAKYLGHDDWRLPTINELSGMLGNSTVIGEFKFDPSCWASGWYWSSVPFLGVHAWDSRFQNGAQSNIGQAALRSVRLVR